MATKEQLNNPIIEQRADPWVYKHTDMGRTITSQHPCPNITALCYVERNL
jgi:GH43 family beta-xylosidase